MKKKIFADFQYKEKVPIKPLFKHQMLIICICVAVIVASTLAGSYAILSKTATGDEYNVVQVGELQLSYVDLNEEGNVVQLNNEFPVSDETGSTGGSYRFSVENTGTLVANYTVRIINDTDTIDVDGCSDNLLDASYIRYKFDNGEVGTLKDIENEDSTGYTVYTSTLQPNESNIHEIRLWLNETSPNSVLGAHYHGKVVIDIEQAEGSDPYNRPDDSASVKTKVFAEENLGENCKTYDDGTDTFLVGQCSNNYVWYSGKLWRVVLKNNETGAVKMVTDNAITTIPYNAADNTTFENSYVDQWLSQEFLPTLHDYEKYLVVNSVWDSTLDASDTPTRPAGTTTFKRTVGLLNAYEYYTTYTNSDGLATSETGYLNKRFWWLITPYSASNICYVNSIGNIGNGIPANVHGARPVVNLKSTIQISEGSGTQSNPYILKGDTQETTNGTTLLNTRYSGEYITFNNELYRIVGVENGLTKITAVDKPSTLVNNVFDSDTSYVINFAEADIKTDLENYYQGLATTNLTSYNMIESNTTWYLGTVGNGASYKASICATVDTNISASECERTTTTTTANIALPRLGEMFTSQITRKTTANFWTLTPYDTSSVRYVYGSGILNNSNFPTYGVGARPSLYLKANVVIATTNSGNGTYEKPYSVELGQ